MVKLLAVNRNYISSSLVYRDCLSLYVKIGPLGANRTNLSMGARVPVENETKK